MFTFGLKSTFSDRTLCNFAISLNHNKNKRFLKNLTCGAESFNFEMKR